MGTKSLASCPLNTITTFVGEKKWKQRNILKSTVNVFKIIYSVIFWNRISWLTFFILFCFLIFGRSKTSENLKFLNPPSLVSSWLLLSFSRERVLWINSEVLWKRSSKRLALFFLQSAIWGPWRCGFSAGNDKISNGIFLCGLEQSSHLSRKAAWKQSRRAPREADSPV